MLNRLEDGTGVITFEEFCEVMLRKNKETELEVCYKVKGSHYESCFRDFCSKEAFRVFYKDCSGCVPAEELEFVLSNLNVDNSSL